MISVCPCGSGVAYSHCCQPLHQGAAAGSAEALMRSRYAAFALRLSDYLLASWHVSSRPQSLPLEHDIHWLGLRIEEHLPAGDQAQVRFWAGFRAGDDFQQLRELSRFVREDGHWFYVDGDAQWSVWRPARNELCPCGSSAKFKRCCGT